jgi:hypothetical protein
LKTCLTTANQIPGVDIGRTQAFTLGSIEHMRLNPIHASEFSGSIYKVFYGEAKAIFAYYDDDTPLWLDHHSDDIDFSHFIQRERLLEWIPERVVQLAQLFVETKFAFLFNPQLIRSVTEIPDISDEEFTCLMSSSTEEEAQKFHAMLQDRKNVLAKIADQVYPPKLDMTPNQNAIIDWVVWIPWLGFVLNIRCLLESDGTFSYEITRLAAGVGNYINPI